VMPMRWASKFGPSAMAIGIEAPRVIRLCMALPPSAIGLAANQ
jgi:hypothetical protein